MDQHLGEEGAHLTDAHHAWAWGAVWRGGEGRDLVAMDRQIFFSDNFILSLWDGTDLGYLDLLLYVDWI